MKVVLTIIFTFKYCINVLLITVWFHTEILFAWSLHRWAEANERIPIGYIDIISLCEWTCSSCVVRSHAESLTTINFFFETYFVVWIFHILSLGSSLLSVRVALVRVVFVLAFVMGVSVCILNLDWWLEIHAAMFHRGCIGFGLGTLWDVADILVQPERLGKFRVYSDIDGLTVEQATFKCLGWILHMCFLVGSDGWCEGMVLHMFLIYLNWIKLIPKTNER